MPNPNEESILFKVNMSDLLGKLPNVEERRKILARDPLACVYGFKLLCKVALKTLFGVRACSNCPECNHSTTVDSEGEVKGCVDAFGSVAEPEGGIYGRVDAYYG